MKHIIYLFTLLFPFFGNAQQTGDTSKRIPNDSYDNFKTQPPNFSGRIFIKNSMGKVLSEEVIYNGQCSECYEKLTAKADSFYAVSKINEAAILYSSAFKLNGNKAKVKHRLKAACSWTTLGDKDKAFDELNRVVFIAKFYDTKQIIGDKCFKPLYNDNRWTALLEGLQENLKIFQEKLNREVKQQ